MRSLGTRLALSYALAATLTMIGLFAFGRLMLESYLVHGLDLLIQDEFKQIESHLPTDYSHLSAADLQQRLQNSAAYGSVLFYFEIHERGRGTLFSSDNLRGRTIPDVPGQRQYNAHFPGDDTEIRVAEFVVGPLDVMIATSKRQVKEVMEAYLRIFLALTAAMLVVSAGIGFGISRLALRPVRLIQETATRIGSDNLAERIPVSDVHDEISNLARLLNATFDRLESSFNQIRRFTAEASHELKTPLSLVRLQAEKLLVEGGLSPVQEEAVQVQLEEISRLNQIIEELLFLSRAEARAITLKTVTENPERFIHSFAQDGRVLAEHRNVHFAEDVQGAEQATFDPKWIRQVLLNLVSNALNVAPAGSTLRLTSACTNGTWRVALEDQGPGVPAGQHERIFERFVRLETKENQDQDKGSGLGLAISRSIVELHGGTIRAEPAPGTGLRVVFTIPAGSVGHAAHQPDRQQHGKEPADPGGNLGKGHQLHPVAGR